MGYFHYLFVVICVDEIDMVWEPTHCKYDDHHNEHLHNFSFGWKLPHVSHVIAGIVITLKYICIENALCWFLGLYSSRHIVERFICPFFVDWSGIWCLGLCCWTRAFHQFVTSFDNSICLRIDLRFVAFLVN